VVAHWTVAVARVSTSAMGFAGEWHSAQPTLVLLIVAPSAAQAVPLTAMKKTGENVRKPLRCLAGTRPSSIAPYQTKEDASAFMVKT
jgi:hypothetical protein